MRKALWLVAALAIVRGLLIAVVIPPFHGVDEQAHFDYVERLVEARALPETAPGCAFGSDELRSAVRQLVEPANFHPEQPLPILGALPDPLLASSRFTRGCGPAATYPPLYYALAAAPVLLQRDAPLLRRLFLARLVSVLLGALAAVFVFLGASTWFGAQREAWLVTLVFLLQPQLAFLFGIVNNDAALFAACAGALWAVAARSWRGLLLAALAAALVKPTFLVFVPALALLSGRRRMWALAPGTLLALVLPLFRGSALPAAGPGAPLSLAGYVAYALSPKHLFFVWHELYWMGWGWADTWLAKPWYLLLLAALCAALASALVAWRGLGLHERALLGLGALGTLASLLLLHGLELPYLRRTGQGLLQGRYLLSLFPLHAAMIVTALRVDRARLGFVALLALMLCASFVRALARYHA